MAKHHRQAISVAIKNLRRAKVDENLEYFYTARRVIIKNAAQAKKKERFTTEI